MRIAMLAAGMVVIGVAAATVQEKDCFWHRANRVSAK
jgi:hypothetical protein